MVELPLFLQPEWQTVIQAFAAYNREALPMCRSTLLRRMPPIPLRLWCESVWDKSSLTTLWASPTLAYTWHVHSVLCLLDLRRLSTWPSQSIHPIHQRKLLSSLPWGIIRTLLWAAESLTLWFSDKSKRFLLFKAKYILIFQDITINGVVFCIE